MRIFLMDISNDICNTLDTLFKGLTQGNHYKRIQIVGCKVHKTYMYLTVSLLKSDGITLTTVSTALEVYQQVNFITRCVCGR